MNKPNRARATARKPKTELSSENNFYEMMPMTMGNHYAYRDDKPMEDDVINEYPSATLSRDEAASTRRLAIATLIGVALVAIALGILFASGLSALRTTLEPAASAVSTLEP